MRTAVTIGKEKDGTWRLVHGPDVSIATQKESVRAFKLGKNDRFVLMRHQESDGVAFDAAAVRAVKVNFKPEVKPAAIPFVQPVVTAAAQIMRGGKR